METKKVTKYPVDARIKIHFDKIVEEQNFQIKNRFHLLNTLTLGIAMGNKNGDFPNKVEIFDSRNRLIGEAKA